eukprot:4325869-Amphidinium_carterae.2
MSQVTPPRAHSMLAKAMDTITKCLFFLGKAHTSSDECTKLCALVQPCSGLRWAGKETNEAAKYDQSANGKEITAQTALVADSCSPERVAMIRDTE